MRISLNKVLALKRLNSPTPRRSAPPRAGWASSAGTTTRVAQVSFENGANDSAIVPIEPGMLVWERLQLSDGTLARLVTSL